MLQALRKISSLSLLVILLSHACTTIFAHASALALPELPPLALLEDAALKHAGLDPQVLGRWQRKSRLAPALPRLQVGYDQKAVQQNTAIAQDSISVTSAGVAIGPPANRVDQDLNHDRGFEVKAVWALDQILFNHDELDVSRESRDLLVFRGRLSDELGQNYFDLKKQILAMASDSCAASDPLERLHAEQLASKVDSLSGGELRRLWMGFDILQSPSRPRSPKLEAQCSKPEGNHEKNPA